MHDRYRDSMRVTYDSICNICDVPVNHIMSHVARVHESCLSRICRRGGECGSAVASLTVTGHTHIHTHTQTIHTRTHAHSHSHSHSLSLSHTHTGAAAIVDPLSLAYQLPAALRLFHEAGLLWAEALVLFKYVAMCCGVLQCVTLCCNVLPCVAVCYRALPCVAACVAAFVA